MHDIDYDGNTPLLLAVEGGSADITRHLIGYGSDVNHYNISRVSPLHTACTIGNLEIVKILITVRVELYLYVYTYSRHLYIYPNIYNAKFSKLVFAIYSYI